jgi:hypothetical protein
LRFMGNEAVHELQAPPLEQVKTALDVIEHMFDGVYELDEKAAELPSGKPRRKRSPGRRTRLPRAVPASGAAAPVQTGVTGTSTSPNSAGTSATAAPHAGGSTSGTP